MFGLEYLNPSPLALVEDLVVGAVDLDDVFRAFESRAVEVGCLLVLVSAMALRLGGILMKSIDRPLYRKATGYHKFMVENNQK